MKRLRSWSNLCLTDKSQAKKTSTLMSVSSIPKEIYKSKSKCWRAGWVNEKIVNKKNRNWSESGPTVLFNSFEHFLHTKQFRLVKLSHGIAFKNNQSLTTYSMETDFSRRKSHWIATQDCTFIVFHFLDRLQL